MGFTSVMADIWRSKSRSALTMSAVAIGIFSVTVISAAGQIGTTKINESLDDMGVNSVLVEAQEAGVTLGDNDIKKARRFERSDRRYAAYGAGHQV